MNIVQPRVCFNIPASPTDGFYSQVAMFRLALRALGGIYEQAPIILFIGNEEIVSLPNKWKAHFGDSVKIQWVSPELYQRDVYRATGDARWKYDYEEYDLVLFCDADTLLVRPIDDLLIRFRQSPSVMGVIAHYPFPIIPDESGRQAWNKLAREFAGKSIKFDHHYTLVPNSDLHESAFGPFYVNYGFVVMTPQMINTMRSTYLYIRPKIAERMESPYFSAQIALTLSILIHNIPTQALPMRYNFPNDPIAESLHQEELEDVRFIHFLRTDKFDRQSIFVNEASFRDFLSLKLEGSNKVLQDHVQNLTKGRYPFK